MWTGKPHLMQCMLLHMLSDEEQALLAYLENFITDRRKERMKTVLKYRTRSVICVLEDLYDPRNGSAVIRNCDALGIQEVHVIENKNTFHTDDQVDLGTAQWLDLHVHRQSGSAEVLGRLKARGYKIAVTGPGYTEHAHPETISLETGPIAVVFGTEKWGASEEAKRQADVFLSIPMFGFVDSFNIAASAAIILHVLSQRIRNGGGWTLDKEDAEQVYFHWVQTTAPHAKNLIQQFKKEYRKAPSP